jgi:predicted transcriptional regulator
MESQRTVHPVRTISFRIAEEKVAALDIIAKAMDRDRSYLLNEVVESYLYEQQQFATLVEQGRDDLRKGKFFSHEEVEGKVDAWESPVTLEKVR